MASGMPGVMRWQTARVASGVTSRGAKPVPPVVTMRGAVSPVRQADEGGLDLGLFVRHQDGLRHGVAGVRQHFRHQRAALVRAEALEAEVGNGDNSGVRHKKASFGGEKSGGSRKFWWVPREMRGGGH